jgi:predicted DNA-binding transcriptional regulator AlpA
MERIAYSVSEVCELIGVSRAWLYAQWKSGKGPARCKMAGRTLVRGEALRAWLASGEFGGTHA